LLIYIVICIRTDCQIDNRAKTTVGLPHLLARVGNRFQIPRAASVMVLAGRVDSGEIDQVAATPRARAGLDKLSAVCNVTPPVG